MLISAVESKGELFTTSNEFPDPLGSISDELKREPFGSDSTPSSIEPIVPIVDCRLRVEQFSS
jgi:hypothetical protein